MSDNEFKSGAVSLSGSVTVTKTAASSWKIAPMRTSVEIKGLEEGRASVTVKPAGGEAYALPEDEATEVAKEFLSLERIRNSYLNLSAEARIRWKHYAFIEAKAVNDTDIEMRCSRCGAFELVPRRTTAGALHDRFAPFGRAHEGCEVEA